MWSATDRGFAISKDGRGAYAFRMSVAPGGTSVNVSWNVYLYNYRRENIGKFTIYAAAVIVGPGLIIPVRHLLDRFDKPLDVIKVNFDQIAYVGVEDIRVTMYFEEKNLDTKKKGKGIKKAWKALHKVKRIVPFEESPNYKKG